MKTLDEVINIFEKACDLERRCEDCSGCLGQENGCPNDGAESVPDALQYLKEYRSDKLQYDADRREWYETWQEKLKKLEESRQKCIDKLKELDIGTLNNPLTWEELFSLGLIGRPVWSEEKRAWFLVADSALDNRSWVDLVDSSGKIIRLGPHDLKQIRLYKREKK